MCIGGITYTVLQWNKSWKNNNLLLQYRQYLCDFKSYMVGRGTPVLCKQKGVHLTNLFQGVLWKSKSKIVNKSLLKYSYNILFYRILDIWSFFPIMKWIQYIVNVYECNKYFWQLPCAKISLQWGMTFKSNGDRFFIDSNIFLHTYLLRFFRLHAFQDYFHGSNSFCFQFLLVSTCCMMRYRWTVTVSRGAATWVWWFILLMC